MFYYWFLFHFCRKSRNKLLALIVLSLCSLLNTALWTLQHLLSNNCLFYTSRVKIFFERQKHVLHGRRPQRKISIAQNNLGQPQNNHISIVVVNPGSLRLAQLSLSLVLLSPSFFTYTISQSSVFLKLIVKFSVFSESTELSV